MAILRASQAFDMRTIVPVGATLTLAPGTLTLVAGTLRTTLTGEFHLQGLGSGLN
jgi:hypothetical protein